MGQTERDRFCAVISRGGTMNDNLIWFENLGMGDVAQVGGKNASLGEMISQLSARGVRVPGGFATTASAYREFLAHQGLADRPAPPAEDLPEASFAGQQETFLNVRGIDAVLTAIKHVFASLYNDRAIAYRVHHRFEHSEGALSAGVQQMVRSDLGASGVVFTLDTESGFRDVGLIPAARGPGD